MKLLLVSTVNLLALSQCARTGRTELMENARSMIGPLAHEMPGVVRNPDLVVLGRRLFFDPRLSANNTISCNNCHNLASSGPGTDNLPVSIGIRGQKGTRNAPTVFNAGFQFVQFWDGRAPDLKEQAKGPILNPVEMGMPDARTVEAKIESFPEYSPLFAKAFNGESRITFDRIAEAIASFEGTLITHDRFDDFMNGNVNAISREEAKGLDLFLHTGCISCHNGPLLGGQMYRKIGVVQPYANKTDLGRFNITHNPEDRYLFKVAPLRNVALTGPYFHDGGASTLEQAVRLMAWMQLGRTLSSYEVYYIVQFLGTLSNKQGTGASP